VPRIAVLSMHTSPLAPLGGAVSGGMNVYVRELSRKMAERGYAVDVFTRRDDPGGPAVVDTDGGVRVVHIDAGPAVPLDKEALPAYVGAFAAGVGAFALEHALRYELVHSHYWLSGLAGDTLKRAWGVPHVVMFHTLGEAKNRARPTEREPLHRIAAERLVARRADRIVVATSHERDLLAQRYGARPEDIAVVPCGVDLDVFHPMDKDTARKQLGLADDERIILFVGRIEPLKGIDILISAAAQLHEEADFFHAVIVGGDARAETRVRELKSLATNLGVEHHVTFVGAVDHERLPLYYSAADVCVVPSFYESFGLVAVEAMACGTPVVASRVGGLVTTVRDGETGYLVPWRCPEPFAERLDLLLRNDELRASLGGAAREAVQRFRWSNVADAMDGIYSELLDRPPAHLRRQ
jgi:D-inositol-3-phosphate glycosyltransferase